MRVPTFTALIVILLIVGLVVGLLLPSPFRFGGSKTDEPPENSNGNQNVTPGENTDPDPDEEDPLTIAVRQFVSTMTLREKICQMLIVDPDTITGVSGTTIAGAVTKAAIEKYPVGGLVLFGPNIQNVTQIQAFTSVVQTYSSIPLFISVDEEGGRVARLKTAFGAHSISAMLSYQNGGEQTAFNNAKTLAETLVKYGFNVDFAPVADVWSNPNNTVIGDRAYSTDFDLAARLVESAVKGFHEGGVACTLKHFPGHGDTREDSHYGSAYVYKTLAELRANEFKPFISGIGAGVDMVMLGHLIVPDVDDLPATLSKKIVTDILRDELGFNGIIITDALAMVGITAGYGPGDIAVMAVLAGVDILLQPTDVDTTILALTMAVQSGEIPASRIDESVARIIRLKVELGLMRL
ncbi:MAG: glycoside hydrolase family 3 protein [Coriobacteriia bacterium]|nr:glycoside hydrolase family 3 protein [Coriobacteriia bacterium]